VGINDLEADADGETTQALIRQMGRETDFYAADISDVNEVEEMFQAFLMRFGRIDILVNNPYAGTGQSFLELTEKNWDLNIDVGLKGFFLCSQQAARAMVEQGDGGSIVSTSSVHGMRAWKTDAAYGAAKAGVIRLTKSMAVDLAEHGIRCNAILPGYMTRITYSIPHLRRSASWVSSIARRFLCAARERPRISAGRSPSCVHRLRDASPVWRCP